ncbi:glucokinase [Hoyosella subflava]|uniref:Glucokinase n=1 Tax=Hoyosella subflava (strain DSM 45089 / JCM 17490 / NBRC 109087 / DQS3-9A1) TaxID=443218 RepID=F6EEZ1_HOYSD|nr:glucokinase [Hoyosella subflava]AEF42128.1 Glucokinase [Hoyosella subflava DQS3-9A1]
MTSIPSIESPWLVADIGGTNARFGVVTEPGGRPHQVKSLTGADYPDLASAIETYMATTSGVGRPTVGGVAVAGPVSGDRFRLTNASWDFSVNATKQALSFRHLALINDFSALALAVPYLDHNAVVPLGGGERNTDLPVAVIGPGTGLGVSGIVPHQGMWIPLATEGGHVTLPVETDLEAQIAALLRRRFGRVSAETVLCGVGLTRLYHCIAAIRGAESVIISPADVCARGRSGADPICVETLQVFCAMLGNFAGNVALTVGARGGVLIGGGILPRMRDVLQHSEFRARFENKAPMTGYVSAISTELIIADSPALLGAAQWITQWLAQELTPTTSEGALV